MEGQQLAVTLHSGDMGVEDILRYARAAEGLGYEGFSLTEENGKEAFALLALLAEATERITLMTGIVSFLTRTPMLLAMGARTIWDLSGGRFRLGVGTGGVGFVEQGHGLEITRSTARAKETVEIVRRFLTEERFSYDGEWFHVKNFHLREGPLEARVPIYLAALGPRMVETAAKYYDGLISNWVTEESLADIRSKIEKACAEVGRDPAEVRLLALEMTPADPDDGDSRNAMRRGCAFYYASKHYFHIAEVSGFAAEASRVRDVWEQRDYKRAASLVSDEFLEKFTLTGSPERCRERLNWLLREGVYPIVYPVPRHALMVEDHFTAIERVARLPELDSQQAVSTGRTDDV
jgi:alkanesulfonate monooxygenase SsuD/methylene tetrahydromethanopterin reductase-like flavin-dependent oxidoreductase (luciferase family)